MSKFNQQTLNGKDLYFVAVKVFLRRGIELLILKDYFGDWDLPGGRIRPDEFNTALFKIVQRKMREELGVKVRYKLGQPAVFMRHERLENGKIPVRIFALGYEAKYLGGKIKLSPRHPRMQWIPLKNFKPGKYFRGGWLKGVVEYLKLKR